MKRLSPLIALATSMHAQPGVYAVLLGSGVSTASGIPTGWGIVRDLVRRVATAAGENTTNAEAAYEDPESWWANNGEGDLGYSTLLQDLGPTQAARQGLLANYFEPDPDETDESTKQPTAAHKAIANLVKQGLVRVIITTNFDRLMERALEAVGVSPQVISRPEAVNGMTPLAHAPATVIKLHGDYKDLGSRNTPEELGEYPHEWKTLLKQIFDEYGLVVSGWSADWDTALVESLQESPNRRYPLYWDARSAKGDNAKTLLATRSGITVEAADADTLFSELASHLEALENLSAPPLTMALALAKLKKYLPNPIHRIDLHDLVMGQVDQVIQRTQSKPKDIVGSFEPQDTQDTYEYHFKSMEQLVPILEAGIWHDPEGVHDQLWIDVFQRLIDAGTSTPSQSWYEAFYRARRVPAFIALAVIGITAMRRGREDLLVYLGTQVEGQPEPYNQQRVPAAVLLNYAYLAESEWIKELPRWSGTRWIFPQSHLFLHDTWEYFFKDTYPDLNEYRAMYHGFEYRVGLLQRFSVGKGQWRSSPMGGEYVGEGTWTSDDVLQTQVMFQKQLERFKSSAWQELLGGAEKIDSTLENHTELLKQFSRRF